MRYVGTDECPLQEERQFLKLKENNERIRPLYGAKAVTVVRISMKKNSDDNSVFIITYLTVFLCKNFNKTHTFNTRIDFNFFSKNK